MRNFGGLIGRAPNDATPENAEARAESLVERGVRAGYEVIDEYLREGRDAAQSFATAESTGTPASLEQLTERMVQHASDLGSAWMDWLRSINHRQREQPEPPGGFATNAVCARSDEPAPAPRGRSVADVPVSVLVASPLPVRVDVRLHGSPPEMGMLAAHPPRRAEDDRALDGVSVEWMPLEARLSVCLALDAGVEPGTYTGALVARETNLPFGTLCVAVQPRSGA